MILFRDVILANQGRTARDERGRHAGAAHERVLSVTGIRAPKMPEWRQSGFRRSDVGPGRYQVGLDAMIVARAAAAESGQTFGVAGNLLAADGVIGELVRPGVAV